MEHTASGILDAEKVALLLLLAAVVVSVAAKWVRVPYTVGLVLIGFAMTPLELGVDISPELILDLLVPPLIFEAAFHIRFADLKRDLWLILLMAIPGVLVTTFLVGWIVSFVPGIALPTALIFGALIAATDPVAVVALFKQLGVPKRLQLLLEGESLFNDGTAIVIFGLMLNVLTNKTEFSLSLSILEFFKVAGGGVAVGGILGFAASRFIKWIDDSLVETAITTALCFGAFWLGETIGVSGVLAVVTAGIVNGNIGPYGMSPTTKIVVNNFWEYLAFLANSVIFLLIGLAVKVNHLSEYGIAIGVAIIATLIARAVGIYGFSLFSKDIPTNWKHVLNWGGLRGAIVLALALGVPSGFEGREAIQAMAFGVVLFTLLVQGFSMEKLVKRLNLIHRTNIQDRYQRRHARFIANRSAAEHLEKMSQQGLLSNHIWEQMRPLFMDREMVHINALKELMADNPTVEIEELDAARREALSVERASLGTLFRNGVISEEIYSELVREVDEALTEQHVNWSQLLQLGNGKKIDVTKMMAVIIQEDDLQNALKGLSGAGFGVDQLPSTGGFLSNHNVTLVIGLPAGREQDVVKTLSTHCKRRVEYVRPSGAILPLQRSTPVEVGGATIFTFDIEAYYEF